MSSGMAIRQDRVLVVVSLDTEEDNWSPSRENITLSNIRALPRLQRLFDRLGVRATHFVSYQVARQRDAADIVNELATRDSVEIGGHLHPWNTPPLLEPFAGHNTMMSNLPADLQLEKVTVLTDTIRERLNVQPTSFRAGRYGFGGDAVRILEQCGYRVDSSITPYLDWRDCNEGPDFREAPLTMYRPSPDDVARHSDDGPIVEVPLSVGFTRIPFSRWATRHDRMRQVRLGPFSLAGIAYRSHFLRKVQLSFETDTVRDMLLLSRILVDDGAPFLHITWHSPSMVPGLSPFVRTAVERDRLYADIERYFEELAHLMPISFATVAEAATQLAGVEPVQAAHGNRC